MPINVIGTVRYGTTGIDNFEGGSGNDVFHMTAEDYVTDNINGGGGADTVDYSASYQRPLAVTHPHRHGRARPGHPRLVSKSKTWMPATSAGMTS